MFASNDHDELCPRLPQVQQLVGANQCEFCRVIAAVEKRNRDSQWPDPYLSDIPGRPE